MKHEQQKTGKRLEGRTFQTEVKDERALKSSKRGKTDEHRRSDQMPFVVFLYAV